MYVSLEESENSREWEAIDSHVRVDKHRCRHRQ
jgi:hypothetical protein